MKYFFFSFMLIASATEGLTQPAEAMIGNKYLLYQHAISKKINDHTHWGIMHIASVIIRHDILTTKKEMPDEMMNQGYIKYQLLNHFSILGGGFYSSATGFKPSTGIQYSYSNKYFFMLLQPRIDFSKKTSYEIFGLMEYRIKVNNSLALYSRLQFMSNHGNVYHNRSYQQIRLGLEYKSVQTGIGMQFDEYGRNLNSYTNIGVFVKKNLY